MKNNPAMDLGLPDFYEVALLHETVAPCEFAISAAAGSIKGKTKRSRGCFKSREEMETERMIHIEVERNRRKQMNEYLQALRQLIPPSYIQRGDQASIIGAAIELVKELKQIVECFESEKRQRISCAHNQPSTTLQVSNININAVRNTNQNNNNIMVVEEQQHFLRMEEVLRGKTNNGVYTISKIAYVEVILIGHDVATIKILSERKQKQLLNIIAALQQALFYTILRTNITTMEQEVLYSFEVKGSINQIYSEEEIARLIQNILDMIHASNIKGSELVIDSPNCFF